MRPLYYIFQGVGLIKMIDEIDTESDDIINVNAFSGSSYDEYITFIRNSGISLPFNMESVVTTNPAVFGPMDNNVAPVGSWVKYFGKAPTYLDGSIFDFSHNVGYIVGSAFGRVVIFDEISQSFIGWISTTDIQIIDVFYMEQQKWVH